MAVSNSSSSVLVTGSNNTLANFTPTNVKVQDSTIYTITNKTKGNDTKGDILLSKGSNVNLTLDSRNTFICNCAVINNGLASDVPLDNLFLSIKDVTLIMKTGVVSEVIAPMKGNEQTQIHFKTIGCTWNSIHPDTELVGSTIFFEAGGDGHIGKHKNAIVDGVKMLWKAKARNEFVLGIHPNWDETNKPDVLPNLRFVSVDGNDYISFFTWNVNKTPADVNNAFMVNPDWCYDVALPNTKPASIRRTYRRGDATMLSSSYWGAITMNIMYLWIDPYTTISDLGVIDSKKSYLNKIDYPNVGTSTIDNNSDIIAMRFSPTIQENNGNKIVDVSIVVFNNNINASINNLTVFRDKIAAIGYTNTNGRFMITEPAIKNYSDYNSHLTDSIVVKNRTANKYHKWWENETKLIIVHDSRNTTGLNAGETYENFTISYRREGFIFKSYTYNFKQPYSPTETLIEDNNYNHSINTTLPITYLNGVTTVTLPNDDIDLDIIYKTIIDFHSTIENTRLNTVLPVTQNSNGIFTFTSGLAFNRGANTKINAGTIITTMKANIDLTYIENIIKVPYEDINGANFVLTCNVNFSFYGEKYTSGVKSIIPFESDLTFKNIRLKSNEYIECVIGGFGHVTKYVKLTKSSLFTIYLDNDKLINKTYPIAYLESIKSHFRTVVDSPTTYAIEIMEDMSEFKASEFLSGFAWWVFKYGDVLAALELYVKKINANTKIYEYGEGYIVNNTNGFKIRLTNDITVNRGEGYYIPIMILDNGDFKTLSLNTSGINLSLPKYAESQASISTDTIESLITNINNGINNSLNNSTMLVDLNNKMDLYGKKLVGLENINADLVKLKVNTNKAAGTRIS